MTETINQILDAIEEQNHIKILYAVESGSRAWGFASPDSDYDVRYVYVRPAEDYLRLDTFPETIEGPLDEVLDFSGWDIRKMLTLLRKTNPSLMECVPMNQKIPRCAQRVGGSFCRRKTFNFS